MEAKPLDCGSLLPLSVLAALLPGEELALLCCVK